MSEQTPIDQLKAKIDWIRRATAGMDRGDIDAALRDAGWPMLDEPEPSYTFWLGRDGA